VDKGLVLESKTEDNFNAIDPNFVLDGKGGEWLVFGSFWDGIKMRRLSDSGFLSTKDTTTYSVARRTKPAEAAAAVAGLPANWEAVEAPFIVRRCGYFYLFTSWDLCCRGLKSTYKTMVGRSKSITGPYVDANGKYLADGGGTELLLANSRWLGPGGGSVYLDSHKLGLVVFHAYDSKTGKPSLQLSTIDWTAGWPHADLER
jgi:arabinan endo-1,5-alpha-L-arabinosidase